MMASLVRSWLLISFLSTASPAHRKPTPISMAPISRYKEIDRKCCGKHYPPTCDWAPHPWRGERIGSSQRNRPRTSAGTNGKAGIQTFRAVFSKNRRKQSLRKKILGISGRAKIKEHRSNPDIQRNPQKAEADCYGHWIRNAQHRKQHSWRHIDQP